MTERPNDDQLVAFLDGELAEAELASIEAWLERDPALRARLKTLSEATTLIRESFESVLREPVPAALLRAASPTDATIVPFPTSARPKHAPQWRRWGMMAAAASVALLVLGGGSAYMLTNEGQPGSGFLDNVAGYHNLVIASATAGENTAFDVPPGAEHKLPIDIKVPNMKPWGLDFQGAKKIVLDGGKPAYEFVYATDNKELGTITVTLWKSKKPDLQPTFDHRDNVNMMTWRHAGLGCVIVGSVANKGYLWNMAQDIAWQLQNS